MGTTDLGNPGDDGSIEKLSTSRDLPFLILGRKVIAGKMTKHAGHGNGAISPWWAKRKIKFVILDILIAWNITLRLNEI